MAFPQYACMDAGGRVPKVGALGDAGAVTEIYPKSDRLLGNHIPLLLGEAGLERRAGKNPFHIGGNRLRGGR